MWQSDLRQSTPSRKKKKRGKNHNELQFGYPVIAKNGRHDVRFSFP